MFTKILIVDDVDLNEASAVVALKELGIATIDCSKYCDEALLKIKKAQQEKQPYQVVITDLSFETDHRNETIKSGQELIQAIKLDFPEIKIIAFSIENKAYIIKSLFDKYAIDGYVVKGRFTMPDLKTAVETIYNSDQKFLSPELRHIQQDKTANEIDNYDITILEHLSQGVLQENMEAKFKELGISPSSKSTIEKHISKLKIYFQAKNTVHLVAITKDLGII
jgi:two-component system, NarL family, captular synthesis response regulator RcsB